jgi:hypothetical protein
MIIEHNVLFISNDSSNQRNIFPHGLNVHMTSLSKSSDFDNIPKDISLIVIDLEKESALLNHILIIKDYQSLHNKPIWGLMQKKNIKVTNLFHLFGGNQLFDQ